MRDLLKFGLLAVGGWWLYQSFAAPQEPGAIDDSNARPAGSGPQPDSEVSAPPSGPQPDSEATPQATEPELVRPAKPATVKEQLLARAGTTPRNVWQWNWFWMQITGNTDGPDFARFRGMSTEEIEATLLTLDEYWSLLEGQGLAGLGCGCNPVGEGALAQHVLEHEILRRNGMAG